MISALVWAGGISCSVVVAGGGGGGGGGAGGGVTFTGGAGELALPPPQPVIRPAAKATRATELRNAIMISSCCSASARMGGVGKGFGVVIAATVIAPEGGSGGAKCTMNAHQSSFWAENKHYVFEFCASKCQIYSLNAVFNCADVIGKHLIEKRISANSDHDYNIV